MFLEFKKSIKNRGFGQWDAYRWIRLAELSTTNQFLSQTDSYGPISSDFWTPEKNKSMLGVNFLRSEHVFRGINTVAN